MGELAEVLVWLWVIELLELFDWGCRMMVGEDNWSLLIHRIVLEWRVRSWYSMKMKRCSILKQDRRETRHTNLRYRFFHDWLGFTRPNIVRYGFWDNRMRAKGLEARPWCVVFLIYVKHSLFQQTRVPDNLWLTKVRELSRLAETTNSVRDGCEKVLCIQNRTT